MNVLVLNCGSSSLKFALLECPQASSGVEEPRRVAWGLVERIGGAATLTFERIGEREGRSASRETATVLDHEEATRRVVAWLGTAGPGPAGGTHRPGLSAGFLRVDAVGHRVVHGGPDLVEPVVVDDGVLAGIRAAERLAPLHNGPSLAGIEAAQAVFGGAVPMVAAFDTAFHAGLPEVATHYAIPQDLARRHGVRRYGFHGLAYRSVLGGYRRLTGVPEERATLVALHLGNGASAAAIRNGRSVETSMGFTPLEGLVMGTRAGDLDPAIVGYLARAEGVPVDTVERWLNQDSGLLGLSGRSRDVRDLLAHQADDPRARLAVDVFCHRAKKYLGAYLAVLGGADAVVFSGGIGEHAPAVRARITDGLEALGVRVDPARNLATVGRAAPIGADGARVAVYVVPADEEGVIARDTVACLGRRHATP